MRGQNQKRFLEFKGLVADGDLFFLHRFQQRALDLGGRPVDLVGQHEIGEDGAAPRGERARLRIVNLRADDVGRQHVGRELQSRKFHANTARQGFHGQRLGQARNTFEQNMTICQESDYQSLDKVRLADDDLSQFIEKRAQKCAGFLHRLIDGVDSGIHWS